jgi:hypothetical protein
VKTQKPRIAVLTKKVEAKKPAHASPAPRTRVQPTKAKLVAALKKLHPMD